MIILYGATGYTGRIVARALKEHDLEPVLAGRHEGAVHSIADPLGLSSRIGGLQDVDLSDATVLLNCAGPFSRTQEPLIDACLNAGVHYLDLAGEVEEHCAAARRDAEARAAGILIMPGAGFGIVPSDCLIAHVLRRMPDAQRVELALKTVGGVSRGTAEVVLGNLRQPGVYRADGQLVERRAGRARVSADFADGDGSVTAVTNPWRGDLASSAPGVPEMEAFMTFPAPVRALMRVPHGGALRALARRLPEGPSDKALVAGRSAVWVSAIGPSGQRATSTLQGPDAYLFTGLTTAACLKRVLTGQAPAGYHTPSSAWGPDLTVGIKGVTRHDAM